MTRNTITSSEASVSAARPTTVDPQPPGRPNPPVPAPDPRLPDPPRRPEDPQPIEEPEVIPPEVPNPIGDPPHDLPNPLGPGRTEPKIGATSSV